MESYWPGCTSYLGVNWIPQSEAICSKGSGVFSSVSLPAQETCAILEVCIAREVTMHRGRALVNVVVSEDLDCDLWCCWCFQFLVKQPPLHSNSKPKSSAMVFTFWLHSFTTGCAAAISSNVTSCSLASFIFTSYSQIPSTPK